jgi:hypothetical protein
MTMTARRTGGVPPPSVGLVAALSILACTPALDWRETRPQGSGVAMMFPCRPERQERPVRVGDESLTLRLHSCTAAGSAFALAVADVADPARVTALLAALRSQAIANVDGTATVEVMPSISGSTPNAQSARLRIVGKRPDGRRVVEHATFFVKGLTLFQATVIGAGEPVDRDAIDTFFGSIRLP